MKDLILSKDEKRLYFEANGLIIIPDNYFFNYKNVKYVEFVVPKLREFHYNNFMFFTNVTQLRLLAPSLMHFEKHSIIKLVGLTSFHLEATNLRTLPEIFVRTKNLRSVILIIPKVRFIPDGLFHSNKNIENIMITAMSTLFPTTILSNNQHLKSLEIDITLNYGIINSIVNVPQLKSLSLKRLQFKASTLCKHYLHLTTLNLQHCEIKRLRFLKCLTLLKYLNLSHNKIVLEAHIFSNNTLLQYLNISYNNLGIIGANYFKGLSNLNSLKMHKCSIIFYKNKFHEENLNIIGIDFSFNYLQSIDNGFLRPLQCLTILDLSNDYLKIIQNNVFYYLQHLEILDLSYNFIMVLPIGTLVNLTNLTFLNLNNNILGRFDSNDLFNLRKLYRLTNLKLSSNFLDEIPDNNYVMMADSLSTLILEKNFIRVVNEYSFHSLSNLTHLNLNFNKIKYLQVNVFNNLSSLITLTLRCNYLTVVEKGLFNHLMRLTWLDLGQNFIHSLDDDLLKFLKVLKYLNLDSNNLTNIPTNLFRSTYELINVNLAWNNLTSLEYDLFYNAQILHTLDIDSNLLPVVDNNLLSKINVLD